MPGREKINTRDNRRARLLIAPLDWGLGHTTRCFPIIKAFRDRGCQLIIACNEIQADLLKPEFPELEFLDLPGYNLQYGRSGWLTQLKILFQLPKILTSIKRESRWLEQLLLEKKIDMVVSDCRFGLSHPSVHSVFITHQLRIKIPFGRLLEDQIQRWNYRFIEKFNECWIPDFENEKGLAGELSHPAKLPATTVKYIGTLSRLWPLQTGNSAHPDLVMLISGPEPQRSIFENLLLDGLKEFNGSVVVIRGLPGEQKQLPPLGKISFHNHLPSTEINVLLNRARLVIARAGYSTVMDLVRLHKRSIIIPTPGQTEQEYLARYLMQKKICLAVTQNKFSLPEALKAAEDFSYAQFGDDGMNTLSSAVDKLLQELELSNK